MTTLRSALALPIILAAALPAASRAQSASLHSTPRPAVSVAAGVFQFDLSGTGTAAMVAARVERPLGRFFLAEGALVGARPNQLGATTTFLAPEAQLQVQLPVANDHVAPYLGVGAGLALDLRNSRYGGNHSDPTLSGAMGVRYWLTDAFGLRGELRVRGIGRGFVGSTAEWTLGTAWRL